MMETLISPRDWELLSAYLDKQLSPSDAAALEARLRSTPALYEAFESLRRTQMVVRSLPYARAPRSFALTPQMAGKRATPSLFPVFGFASALACLLLIIVLVSDFLMPGRITSLPVALAPTDTPIAPEARSLQEPVVGIAPLPQATAFPTPTSEEASLAQESVEMSAEPSGEQLDDVHRTIFPTMSPAPTYVEGDVATYLSPDTSPEFQEKQIVTITETEMGWGTATIVPTMTEVSPTPTATATPEPSTTPTQTLAPAQGEPVTADNAAATAESQAIPDVLLTPASPGQSVDEAKGRPPFFIIEVLLAVVAIGAGIVAVYLRRKTP